MDDTPIYWMIVERYARATIPLEQLLGPVGYAALSAL